MATTLASLFADINKGKWQCKACLVFSADHLRACASCETPRPGAAAGTPPVPAPTRGNSTLPVPLAEVDTPSRSLSGFHDMGIRTKHRGEVGGTLTRTVSEQEGFTGFNLAVGGAAQAASTGFTFPAAGTSGSTGTGFSFGGGEPSATPFSFGADNSNTPTLSSTTSGLGFGVAAGGGSTGFSFGSGAGGATGFSFGTGDENADPASEVTLASAAVKSPPHKKRGRDEGFAVPSQPASKRARHLKVPGSRTGRPTGGGVFTAGLGEQGELGRGDDDPENDMMSRRFKQLEFALFKDKSTKYLSVCTGTMTSAVLAELGGKRYLATWGGEDCGMGRGYNPDPDEFVPDLVPLPDGCVPKEIGVGNTILAVLAEDGRLFLSGGFTNSNNKKSFGTEYKCKKFNLQHFPVGPPGTRLEHVACGNEFVVASCGRDVYIVGYDPTWRFPDKDKFMADPTTGARIKMPENIQLMETEKRCYRGTAEAPTFTAEFDIRLLRARNESVGLVSAAGRLYMCGLNDHGQAGRPAMAWDEPLARPVAVDAGALAGRAVRDVAVGQYTLVATADGAVFAFGLNKDYQLGTGEGCRKSQHEPREVALPDGVRATSVGAGTMHAFAIGESGELYGWGCALFNEDINLLGLGSSSREYVGPTRVEGAVASMVCAGDKHSVLIQMPTANPPTATPSLARTISARAHRSVWTKDEEEALLPPDIDLDALPNGKVEELVANGMAGGRSKGAVRARFAKLLKARGYRLKKNKVEKK